MTTKRRLQSEGESNADDTSPQQTLKIVKSSNSSPANGAIDDTAENEDAGSAVVTTGHNLRVSVRNLRRREDRKESEGASDDAQDHAEDFSVGNGDGHAANGSNNNTDNGSKVQPAKKRSWGLWSAEDQRLFFIALNECGKNFEAIELFFQTKMKKGGKASAANAAVGSYKHKEQIRTFYYRTWHKISKYVQFPENLKKSTRELYALINFGELRKRVGNNLDWKLGAKLHELVFNGHTTIRIRGKNVRLRTPTCPALKRLNLGGSLKRGKLFTGLSGSFGGASNEILLPRRVTLDLVPLLVSDCHRVNKLAMCNPRVSFNLELDCRLSSVVKRLEARFQPLSERTWFSCLAVLPPSSTKQIKLKNGFGSDYEMWVVPRPGATLKRPSIVNQEPTTSASLSLSHLQSKFEPIVEEKSASEENSTGAKNQTEGLSHSTTVAATGPEVGPSVKSEGDENKLSADSYHHPEPATKPDCLTANPLYTDEERPSDGWNLERASRISIGELYLMMGAFRQPQKQKAALQLCYTWRKRQHQEQGQKECGQPAETRNGQSSGGDSEVEDQGVLASLVKFAQAELVRRQTSRSSMPYGSGTNGSPIQLKIVPRQTVSGITPRNLTELDGSGSGNGNVVASVCHFGGMEAQAKDTNSTEFRRPAVPPLRPAPQQRHQAFRQQLDLLLPKYNLRKGRTISRSKSSILVRQLQAASNRPLQPKAMINSFDGSQQKILLPSRRQTTTAALQPSNFLPAFTTSNASQPFTLTVRQSPSQSGMFSLGQTTIVIEPTSSSSISGDCNLDNIPQISIPSPAPYHQSEHIEVEHETDEVDDVNHNDDSSFSLNLSLFDENSRTDMDTGHSNSTSTRSAVTSTPTHIHVDHFLDSVLENSNSSLLQTPRRSSMPPSPPGGMNENSWLPELSLTSFLNTLPNDSSTGVSSSSSASKMMLAHQEDSLQSNGSEVDRQLSYMLNENSLDFTSKFAHLASAMNE